MRKVESVQNHSGRKRQLNVIYFIDASKTHTITVSIWLTRLLGVIAVGVVVWSLASAVWVASLLSSQNRLLTKLHKAMNTVFEYETRVDDVFDLAYPPAKSTAPALVQEEKIEQTSASVASNATGSIAESERVALGLEPTVGPFSTNGKQDPAEQRAAFEFAEAAIVSVSHPAIITKPESLELKFDLTTRSGVERAEGFIFAIAEFVTDKGERLFIGAPKEIEVTPTGEPKQPLRATPFAIRRFKQKEFKFPIASGKFGIFTKVHIAVIGSNGSPISSFDLPVDFRIGKNGWENSTRNHSASKPG